jgi:imidazolonepropionase-like amidohydrolase
LCQIVYGEEFYLSPKAFLDTSSGNWITDKKIHVKNGIIVSLEAKNVFSKIKTYALSDYYLLPGLIDSHAHVFLTQTKKDKGFEQALERESHLSDIYRTARAREFLKQYVQEGFTTIFDLGNSGQFLDVLLRNKVRQDSQYPLMLVSGPGITNRNGQFSSTADPQLVKKEYSLLKGNENLTRLLTLYQHQNVDILKIYFDNEPSKGGLSVDQVRQILAFPGIKKFKKITAHAIERASLEKVLASKIPNIEHASDLTVDERFKNTIVTVTGVDKELLKEFNYYNKAIYQFQVNNLKRLLAQKNILLFGPDYYFHDEQIGFSRARRIKQCISFFKDAGATNLQILQAMTINPAKSVGLDNKIGVIKVGALANMIVMSQDPLSDITALTSVHMVVNKGKIIFSGEGK